MNIETTRTFGYLREVLPIWLARIAHEYLVPEWMLADLKYEQAALKLVDEYLRMMVGDWPIEIVKNYMSHESVQLDMTKGWFLGQSGYFELCVARHSGYYIRRFCLSGACIEGYIEIVRALIDLYKGIDAISSYDMSLACQHDYVDIVQLLLKHGATGCGCGQTIADHPIVRTPVVGMICDHYMGVCKISM